MSFEAAKELETTGADIAETRGETDQKTVDETARPALKVVRDIEIDRSRDALLTDFGKKTMEDRYLLPGEKFQDMFSPA